MKCILVAQILGVSHKLHTTFRANFTGKYKRWTGCSTKNSLKHEANNPVVQPISFFQQPNVRLAKKRIMVA